MKIATRSNEHILNGLRTIEVTQTFTVTARVAVAWGGPKSVEKAVTGNMRVTIRNAVRDAQDAAKIITSPLDADLGNATLYCGITSMRITKVV